MIERDVCPKEVSRIGYLIAFIVLMLFMTAWGATSGCESAGGPPHLEVVAAHGTGGAELMIDDALVRIDLQAQAISVDGKMVVCPIVDLHVVRPPIRVDMTGTLKTAPEPCHDRFGVLGEADPRPFPSNGLGEDARRPAVDPGDISPSHLGNNAEDMAQLTTDKDIDSDGG